MIQNNKTDFKTKRTLYKKDSVIYYFYRIVIRMIVFLFLILASLLVLYFVGNYQEFLDSNEKIILNLAAIISVTTALFLILGLILNTVTYLMLKRKTYRYVIYTVLYLVMLVFSAATFFVSRSILLVSNGL